MHCSHVRSLWVYYAGELHCPAPSSLHLRQYILAWWYRSSFSSLFGVFKIIIPAIILHNIWRGYASLVYGEQGSVTRPSLQASVKYDITIWCKKITGTKLAADPRRYFSWLPPLSPPRATLVRWLCPPSGRLKLNTDAAVGRQYAAGGVILRDHTGACVVALSFRLPPSTPLHAEIQAAFFGLLYFLPLYRNITLESDCAQMISRLARPQMVHGNYYLQHLHPLIYLHRIEYHHIYREANMAAHYLAQYAMQDPITQVYSSHTLPALVRSATLLDLSSVQLRVV